LITPFFMADLGIWFVILITLLNLSWLVLSLNMFKPITDYKRYAKTVFVFSLNYILIFYVMIIVAGLLI
ncbi:MAG TPA: protoheme IX farnesyltransferase, partial [Candidatus Nosocomiicoccus stercorigallinarum]|nr:protoheme IX farnesyltransferase [Candidatus Nosocomiicoccus stercorigallinarum]